MAILPNAGLTTLTSLALGKTVSPTYYVHLFVDNITPDLTFVTGASIECSMTGYAPILLTNSSWTIATIAGICTATYPELSFVIGASTSQTIYGFTVTLGLSGTTIWADNISPAFVVPGVGATFNLFLTFQDVNCSS